MWNVNKSSLFKNFLTYDTSKYNAIKIKQLMITVDNLLHPIVKFEENIWLSRNF